mgnify:FL=1
MKLVLVFHQGFQTPRNGWQYDAEFEWWLATTSWCGRPMQIATQWSEQLVKNRNWQQPDKLATHKRSRGGEPETIWNKSSWWSEWKLELEITRFQVWHSTTRPRCLPSPLKVALNFPLSKNGQGANECTPHFAVSYETLFVSKSDTF